MLSYEDRNNKPMWKVNQMQQPNNKILFYSSAKTMKWLALICGAHQCWVYGLPSLQEVQAVAEST